MCVLKILNIFFKKIVKNVNKKRLRDNMYTRPRPNAPNKKKNNNNNNNYTLEKRPIPIV